MSYSKILIAVDSSEYSIKAAQNGFQLAEQLGATVALLFVVDTSKAVANIDTGVYPEQALFLLKKEAEQTLNKLAAMHNGKEVIKFMPQGIPTKDIIKTAEKWEADLIVLGTHGRTGLMHLLIGSVSESIIRHSKIPVMVYPSK
jgi:nucleotide-binding universal stress UspA family protein